MLIEEIANAEVPALVTEDKIETALQYMEDWKVSHLPVVERNRYIGLLDESALVGLEGNHIKVSEFELLDVSVDPKQHLFEAIRVMTDYKLSLLPVVDNAQMFIGEIQPSGIMACLADLSAVREDGSVIVLEMADVDYSLSDIGRHVEENDAKIYSAFVSRLGGGRMIEVTLKINRDNIRGVIQTLQRHEYKIKAFYDAPSYEADIRNRYEELMRYLNI